MTPLLGVIFDFDGVIADSEPLHLRAYQEILSDTSLTLSDDAYTSTYLGYDDVGVFSTLARDQGVELPPETLTRLIAAKGECFRRLVASEDVVFPEARRCVERLGDSLTLGIASGALHREIEDILSAARLRSHFVAIVAADDVERSKPDPETYRRAIDLVCRDSGREPSPQGLVAIEDSAWGIASARAAGLPCLGVTTTYEAAALTTASRVVTSLDDVDLALLSSLGQICDK